MLVSDRNNGRLYSVRTRDAIIGFTFTADTRQAHAQKASKSLCVQWASIIACWCCPVQTKQFPFPARFAPPQTERSVCSHCDGGV